MKLQTSDTHYLKPTQIKLNFSNTNAKFKNSNENLICISKAQESVGSLQNIS
jgi:hypothetical protein